MSIQIREAGLRDGLQMVTDIVPTDIKLQWLAAEHAAGVRHFDVTAFVSPRAMPQSADAETMVAEAAKLPGVQITALALNGRGAQRALDAGVHTLAFVISASGAHSRGNAGRSTEQALAEFRAMVDQVGALPAASRPRILAGVATAFGCTMEGHIDPDHVRQLVSAIAQAGADEIALADTVGYAQPRQVGQLCRQVLADVGGLPLCIHLHDTRGLGLANAVSALEAGVTRFDAALGGIGGCPFAPGASGNIATEDLVYLMHAMGVDTGIDLPALLEVRAQLPSWLPGVDLYGSLSRAGIPAHQLASWNARKSIHD